MSAAFYLMIYDLYAMYLVCPVFVSGDVLLYY